MVLALQVTKHFLDLMGYWKDFIQLIPLSCQQWNKGKTLTSNKGLWVLHFLKEIIVGKIYNKDIRWYIRNSLNLPSSSIKRRWYGVFGSVIFCLTGLFASISSRLASFHLTRALPSQQQCLVLYNLKQPESINVQKTSKSYAGVRCVMFISS